MYSCEKYIIQVWRVHWDRRVEKQIDALPAHIVGSFYDWVRAVERDGMESVRRLPGYHDEGLKGELKGVRSVRLTKAYRVLYVESVDGNLKIAYVTRVSKHDYEK